MLLENIKNAFKSIAAAKLRSFLTMLGIIIGVAAVALMIGIGDGVKQSVSNQITDLGTNLITVVSGNIGGSSQGSRGPSINPGTLGTTTLTSSDAEKIRSVSGVSEVAEINIISSSVAANSQTSSSGFVVGATPNYFIVRKDTQLESGRVFTDQENRDKAKVAVIGPNLKTTLFPDVDPLGQSVKLRGQEYKVVGVIQKSDQSGLSVGTSFDDVVYIPLQSGNALTNTSNQVYRIISTASSSSDIESVKSDIEKAVLENHGGQKDFSVLTQKDLLSTFSSILDLLTSFIVAIASISLVVGGIGIMNIMLVSVTERTREIGIRKAIGATFGNILGQFISEAVILSVAGGLIGVGVAYLVGMAVQKYANITPVFSVTTIALAVGVSAAVGIIFGVAPAVKAARKRPIQALKAI